MLGQLVDLCLICFAGGVMFQCLIANPKLKHMGSEGRLYLSKSTNGGKGLQNSKINSYFTP